MKTKNLVIIFILFLLITLLSGLEFFLTRDKEQPALNQTDRIINSDNQPMAEEKSDEVVINKPLVDEVDQAKPTVLSEKIPSPVPGAVQAEKIQAKMLINGVEYDAAVKPNSSVYDLMSTLREEKKIDFKNKDYSALGFFIEEINGVRNNPSGKNWVYYINGQPGKVGVSYYKLKNNDVIEWKYEKKSF